MSTTSRTHRKSRARVRRWKKEAVRSRGRGSSPVGEPQESRGAPWGGAAGWLIGADVLALEDAGLFGDPGSQEVLKYIQQASYVEDAPREYVVVDDASLADPHLATAVSVPGEGAYERGLAMHLDIALGRLSRRGLRTVSGRMRTFEPKMQNFPYGKDALGGVELTEEQKENLDKYKETWRAGMAPEVLVVSADRAAVQEGEGDPNEGLTEENSNVQEAIAGLDIRDAADGPLSDIFPRDAAVPERAGIDIEDSPTIASLKPEHRAYFRAGDFSKDCAARDALKAAGLISYHRGSKTWVVMAP